MMTTMMTTGVDAHKRRCTALMFDGDSAAGSFDFPTTRSGVSEFMEKVPEGSTVVIEASTTGKVLSKLLSQKYDVHMVAPPERKISVKTDKRDCERIVKEDSLGYLRRCYIPTPYIEEMRSLVSRQVQTGHDISRVKSRIHALLEMNMVQEEFEGLSDIFGARGLKKMAKLQQLPRQDMIALARYLDELKLHVSHHRQLETEMARVAASDKEVKLLMSIPGVSVFTAVAMKARIGDISRFPTKKQLCSYAGVVPKANNSGDYVSQHNHVKHGDSVLKYALTCAVRGAVRAAKNSSVKLFYQKMMQKGVSPQKAQVAAARKMACIAWKVLVSGHPYVEEDEYLTERKMKEMSRTAARLLPPDVMPAKVQELADSLMGDIDVLDLYPEEESLSDNTGSKEDDNR